MVHIRAIKDISQGIRVVACQLLLRQVISKASLSPMWGEKLLLSIDLSFQGLRGVAFMTDLAVLQSTLPSSCLSCKMQDQEATVTALTVFAVSVVLA